MEEIMMNGNKENIENEVIGDVIKTSGETSDKGTIVAMAIGAGIAVAGFVVGKLVRKAIDKYKAKKKSVDKDNDGNLVGADFEEVTESDED